MSCICCCPPKADDDAAAQQAAQRAISIRENAQDLPRPEWKITLFVFLEMFLASATSSVATVGVVWATVVLLGGFVSKLNILDFWLVIAVTLIQSMRIFGGDWNPDQKILYGFLDENILNRLRHRRTLTAFNARICYILLWMMEAMMFFVTPNMTFILQCGKLVFFSGAFVVALLKNTVLLVTLVMSVTHLVYPGFGDTGQSTEDINKKTSILIFYGVAIAQAMMSYLVFAYSQARPELLRMVSNSEDYRFDDTDKEADEALSLYYIHVRKICRDGRISAALDMNLATFAVQCLKSNERDVNRSGIRLLNNLTQGVVAQHFRTEAITKLGDSHEAVESLFRLVASTSPEDKRERKMAALLIENLPDSFHISGFLFAMRSVCSLLEATKDEGLGMVVVDETLVRIGLNILQKFSGHVWNLPDISDSHELTVKITRYIEISEASDADHIDFVKAKYSLSVLGKLAGATGKRGCIARQDILQNVLLLSSVREMVQNPSNSFVLRELAILVIDGFALDPETRNHGATRKMAMVLLSIFCSPHEANDEVQINFQLAAGRAVARLTTESTSNCDAIIMAEEGNLEALRSMISSQPTTTAKGVVAANVLRNLCEYLTPGTPCQDTMRGFAQENMTTVLTRICETDNLVGEAMEAYLSLALQLSRATPAEEFDEALNGIGCERFVQKLNSVVYEANAPARAADWSPGIRRSAIELAIRMMRPGAGGNQLPCTQHVVSCGMRNTLMAVRATREENYKLVSAGGAPVLEHEESLSALVKKALRLIPEEAPNAQ